MDHTLPLTFLSFLFTAEQYVYMLLLQFLQIHEPLEILWTKKKI